MPDDEPFWKRKTLAQMTPREWESLCDGCGRCCCQVVQDVDTDEYHRLAVACRLLDGTTCRCKRYATRLEEVPGCVQMTLGLAETADWLPRTCAYRKIARGESLDWWHPLVSGDPTTVHRAHISVSGRVISEEFVDGDDAFDYPLDD